MSSLQTTLGVFCGLGAELFGSYANIQIKYSHVLEESKPLSQQLTLTRRSRFYVAIFLYSLNTILNVVAYAFASLNVLAPTSSLTIVMNAILARIYFNEVLSKVGILASIIIMLGSTIAVLYGKNEALSLDLKQLEILFSNGYVLLFGIFHWSLIICSLLIGKILSKQFINETSIVFMEEEKTDLMDDDETSIGVLLQTADKSESDASIFDMYTSDPNFAVNVDTDDGNMNGFQLLWKMVNDSVLETFSWNRSFQHTFRAFCYAFSVGSLAAWVQLIGKAIGILLSESFSGNPQFTKAGTWMIILFGLFLLYFLLILMSEMLKLFETVLIIPLYETFIILNMILLDVIVMKEMQHSQHMLGFWFGILMCIAGMFLLAVGQRKEVVDGESVINDNESNCSSASLIPKRVTYNSILFQSHSNGRDEQSSDDLCVDEQMEFHPLINSKVRSKIYGGTCKENQNSIV